jgi:hypothetical protein
MRNRILYDYAFLKNRKYSVLKNGYNNFAESKLTLRKSGQKRDSNNKKQGNFKI